MRWTPIRGLLFEVTPRRATIRAARLGHWFAVHWRRSHGFTLDANDWRVRWGRRPARSHELRVVWRWWRLAVIDNSPAPLDTTKPPAPTQ